MNTRKEKFDSAKENLRDVRGRIITEILAAKKKPYSPEKK